MNKDLLRYNQIQYKKDSKKDIQINKYILKIFYF
jgi:hypothetical protein